MTTRPRARDFYLLPIVVLLVHLVPTPVVSEISPPYLVDNFDDRPAAPPFPIPTLLLPVGDRRAVVLEDRLWVTDGTESGTVPWCDRALEGGSGDCPRVERVLVSGRAGLFFLSARRLWVTDGTLEGTFPLTDPPWRFRPGFGSGAFLLHRDRGLFFFSAHHPLLGTEPWVSDGTPEGTRSLGDLAPGSRSSNPAFGAVLGDRVVMAATDRDRGREPWITDGTPEGTRLLREIDPGPVGSSPEDFHSLADRVVFSVEDELPGRELWVTDGTPEGTEPLPEVVPGSGGPVLHFPADSQPFGLFFLADVGRDRSLWFTDGTPEGTREIRRSQQSPLSGFEQLAVTGELAFFGAKDGSSGSEPWISDGTLEGTRLLADLCPGVCSSDPDFRPFGRHVFVTATDGDRGRKPWVSDGTPEGTRRLRNMASEPLGTSAHLMAGNERRLFFATRLPSLDGALSDTAFWVSEAPFSAATLLVDPGRHVDLQLTDSLLAGDDLLTLVTDDTAGLALWRSDGTRTGTQPIRTLIEPGEQGSSPSGLSRVGNRIYFATGPSLGPGPPATLWRTRGTRDTTVPVSPIPEGPTKGIFEVLTPLRDRLVFSLRELMGGPRDLWATGGTADTAVLLARDVDLFQSSEEPLPATDELAFFLRNADTRELWVTDGTTGGTRRLREIRPGLLQPQTVFQDRLFFQADVADGRGDFELWVSDGTPEGTAPFADLHPEGSSEPRDFTPVGEVLYFTAATGDGRRVWRTDGTRKGTRPVELPPEATEIPTPLSGLGNRLIFTSFLGQGAPDLFTEHALWITDGTREGTTRLADLRLRLDMWIPGPVLQSVVVGTELFFLDPGSHVELGSGPIWRTDGTPEGTFPWPFLPPDRAPIGLHAVEGGLAIAASSPAGRELWWSGDFSSAELVGAFDDVAELTRLDNLVLFRGKGRGLGSELWAFETPDFSPPPSPPRPDGIPQAPDGLEVFPSGFGQLTAVWRDRSPDETSFILQARHPWKPEFHTVAVVPANTESLLLRTFDELPFTFRVRAQNENGASGWSREASVTPGFQFEACVPSDEHLCLLGGRFEVRVHWWDPFNESNGIGHAAPFDFSDDSGSFWFFDRENVELVVKVLDARRVNGFHWAFYGALSNVEYWVTVRDLLEGTSRTYHNPAGNLCGFGDTRAFPRPGPPAAASSEAPLAVPDLPRPEVQQAIGSSPRSSTAATAGGETGGCEESDTALCLTDDRFRVEVEWHDPRSGDTGVGVALPGTDDSGFFWFFDPENVELVVKVLDARTVNEHFWVFSGGLSDVEYTITVTDTVEDVARQYRNEAFDICGQADTAAF